MGVQYGKPHGLGCASIAMKAEPTSTTLHSHTSTLHIHSHTSFFITTSIHSPPPFKNHCHSIHCLIKILQLDSPDCWKAFWSWDPLGHQACANTPVLHKIEPLCTACHRPWPRHCRWHLCTTLPLVTLDEQRNNCILPTIERLSMATKR